MHGVKTDFKYIHVLWETSRLYFIYNSIRSYAVIFVSWVVLGGSTTLFLTTYLLIVRGIISTALFLKIVKITFHDIPAILVVSKIFTTTFMKGGREIKRGGRKGCRERKTRALISEPTTLR